MDATTTPSIAVNKRNYLRRDLQINSWEDISQYYDEILNREINSSQELFKWLKDRSELDSAVQENAGWRYIKMTCDTTNKEYADAYTYFVSEIEPKISPISNSIDKKLLSSPYLSELNDDRINIALRGIKKQVEIFREANIPLQAEIKKKEQKYGELAGGLSIEHDGKELTLQQASNLLKSTDRELRETIFKKINQSRASIRTELESLFDDLVKLRHQIAINADFKNFRDYMFAALGRFDYTANDCFRFHESIKSNVTPIVKKFGLERKNKLGYDKLRPWDMSVDPEGLQPLKPFETGEQLMETTIHMFTNINPFLGKCMQNLKDMQHIDLESRKGKAPGGYNYPLYETGAPFIFMNASGSLRDVVTIVHEGGHAVHSFLTDELELADFKSTPSEVAELASMTMELISLDNWNKFFSNDDELTRAKKEHLQKVIEVLPWIAIVDKFQHWIYENPEHTRGERKNQWKAIYMEFSTGLVDHTGFEDAYENAWHSQLHIFEVPFYYIEYGFAQLGAIAIWKNFKENPSTTYEQYIDALKLGYTATIPNIYKAAGIQFNFSEEYVKELSHFISEELAQLD
ncbi:MAG: M3 family oligoendopeptidase [Bacteroidia bacterium]|nr:M3 family oligoendopeptidase [Bacteroidia bacterium]